MTEIKEILKMSVAERLHLVETIWDSIAAESEDDEISEEHKSILNDRLESYYNNPENNISRKEVDKKVRGIL
jgi:putative addiction module component (TIGR02574 family)